MWNDVARTGNINGVEAEIREMFCNDAVMGDKDAFAEKKISGTWEKEGLVLVYLNGAH